MIIVMKIEVIAKIIFIVISKVSPCHSIMIFCILELCDDLLKRLLPLKNLVFVLNE